jgi:hypothetical protein
MTLLCAAVICHSLFLGRCDRPSQLGKLLMLADCVQPSADAQQW